MPLITLVKLKFPAEAVSSCLYYCLEMRVKRIRESRFLHEWNRKKHRIFWQELCQVTWQCRYCFKIGLYTLYKEESVYFDMIMKKTKTASTEPDKKSTG